MNKLCSGIYKHHSGTLYQVVGFATLDGESYVIYFDRKNNAWWSRPVSNFNMEFKDGKCSRFVLPKLIETNRKADKEDYPIRVFESSCLKNCMEC
tara:strand:+ start:1137 stop:1421 length:285 start_codon:yes stop_codon:yes gene_type:complete